MIIKLTESDLHQIIKEVINEIRPTLYTNTINKKDANKRNHSPIKRSKYGVGKNIGGEIYIHVNYVNRIPQNLYETALKILRIMI